MEIYLQYAQTFGSSEKVLKWIQSTLKNYLIKNNPSQEEVEHVIDYLSSDKSPDHIAGMAYDDAKKNTEKWTKALIKKGGEIQETKKDIEVVLDFKDGYKIVKLIGENAYKREGSLMGHCVGGYFGNGKEIYSLRDKDNIPHCTMEKDQQIKGRGNKDVIAKYIDYIVKFLEFSGMSVRDSEMAHLGYEVVKFGLYALTKLYKDRYAPKGTQIEYKKEYIIIKVQSQLENYSGDKLVLFDGDINIT